MYVHMSLSLSLYIYIYVCVCTHTYNSMCYDLSIHNSIQQYTKSAYIYKNNTWVGVKELPTGRRGKMPNFDLHNEICWKLFLAVLMCGPVRASPGGRVDKIVAAGGWAGSRLDNIDIYDINSDTWVTGE